MSGIALGTKVFSRVDKLGNLLKSADNSPIEKVYIADNGKPTSEKEAIYNDDYSFDIEVFDLEYDAGLGYGRNYIVNNTNEEFLIIVDPDHIVPANIMTLIDQLESRPDVGGIAGTLIEPDRGRMWQSAHDLHEQGNILKRHVEPRNKSVEFVSGHPYIEFDFIPNAAVFRLSCLEDYSWDPEYTIGKEHLDFYVGHMKETRWKFGVCPTVIFPHYPGGDIDYTSNRTSDEKLSYSNNYFLNKWQYDKIIWGRQSWYDSHQSSNTLGRAAQIYNNYGVYKLVKMTIDKYLIGDDR